MILLLAISKQFGRHPSDVPFCLFAQTFVFVAYNKVVTSQYFLWYLSLLPLVFPARIRMTKSEMATVLLLWGFTQASWLLPAFFLEFMAAVRPSSVVKTALTAALAATSGV